jgi:hypothetical protein
MNIHKHGMAKSEVIESTMLALCALSLYTVRSIFVALQMNIVENANTDRREPPKKVDPEGKHKARKIDKVSRKLFPMAFLVFNIIYWIVYTLPSVGQG